MTCRTCQDEGEIVTDWNRYLDPFPGDKGDEAVAVCPDCAGQSRKSIWNEELLP